jgi:serine/threonine protein kinase
MAGADPLPDDEKPTRRFDSDDRPTGRGLAEGQVVLGRFVLQRLLGQGGMGVVWLARDQSLGDEVALKFVSDLLKRDAAAVDDLKAETRKARQLTHPHIVRIHEFWEDALPLRRPPLDWAGLPRE